MSKTTDWEQQLIDAESAQDRFEMDWELFYDITFARKPKYIKSLQAYIDEEEELKRQPKQTLKDDNPDALPGALLETPTEEDRATVLDILDMVQHDIVVESQRPYLFSGHSEFQRKAQLVANRMSLPLTQVVLLSLMIYTDERITMTEQDIASLNCQQYIFFSLNEKTHEHLEALCRRGYIKTKKQTLDLNEGTDPVSAQILIDSFEKCEFSKSPAYYMPSEVFYDLNKIHV